MQYSIVDQGDKQAIVVLLNGELETVSSADANFTRIKSYLSSGGDSPLRVRELMDTQRYVSAGLTRLSDRVAMSDGQITFDGDVIDTALSRHLLRLLREGNDAFRPTVLFMEHLAQNPSPLSRRHLWSWLDDRDFSLTPEGHVIGYKAVHAGSNHSLTPGRNTVEVNGRAHTGHVPNPIGAVVSMPRSQVNPDRDHGCSVGLHVGTWDYADTFGGADSQVLTVSVNPRDVVAVPRDCHYQKMRVCRYTVLAVTHERHDTALVAFEDEDDDPDDYFWDE